MNTEKVKKVEMLVPRRHMNSLMDPGGQFIYNLGWEETIQVPEYEVTLLEALGFTRT